MHLLLGCKETDMSLEILYSDPHIVVCVKEAGVSSQSPGMPERIAEVIGGDVPLTVHRLDRDVAGVMVYARTPEAASSLTAQITAGTPEKIYYAVLHGSPEETGDLQDLLYHDPKRNKTFVVDRKRRGVREARLSYRILSRADGEDGVLSLAEIRLHTGRTHQIRVQFGSRKFPVAGDGRYGGGKGQIALFSHSFAFRHPISGEEMRFSALPEMSGVWVRFREELC